MPRSRPTTRPASGVKGAQILFSPEGCRARPPARLIADALSGKGTLLARRAVLSRQEERDCSLLLACRHILEMVMPTLPRMVVVVLIAVHVSAIRAGADPIRVVAGSLSIDTGGPPSFTFFTADGRTYAGDEFFHNWNPSCFTCAPGSSIDLAIAPSADGSGFLSRDGVHGFPVIRLNFSAPSVTLPPDTGMPHVTAFQVPFTFAGQLTGFPTSDLSGQPLFDVALTGGGTASLNMFVEESAYLFSHLDYDFNAADPVPEPGTILLVSAGGALLWRRRRRRAS